MATRPLTLKGYPMPLWPSRSKTTDMQNRCPRCGGPSARSFPTPYGDISYCSEACFEATITPFGHVREVVKRPSPYPPDLEGEAQKLIEGKHAKGMYFDKGRVSSCGSLNGTSSIFIFCSYECRKKAIQPYLPHDYVTTYFDDPEYNRLSGLIDEVSSTDPAEFERHYQHELGKSRSDVLHRLECKRIQAQGDAAQRMEDQEFDAYCAYMRDWETQRGYFVKVAQEREEKRLREERLQREEEMRIEEEKQAEYEALIAPRPVPELARLEHTVIVAGSGWGKTQLLGSLIAHDLQKSDPPPWLSSI